MKRMILLSFILSLPSTMHGMKTQQQQRGIIKTQTVTPNPKREQIQRNVIAHLNNALHSLALAEQEAKNLADVPDNTIVDEVNNLSQKTFYASGMVFLLENRRKQSQQDLYDLANHLKTTQEAMVNTTFNVCFAGQPYYRADMLNVETSGPTYIATETPIIATVVQKETVIQKKIETQSPSIKTRSSSK